MFDGGAEGTVYIVTHPQTTYKQPLRLKNIGIYLIKWRIQYTVGNAQLLPLPPQKKKQKLYRYIILVADADRQVIRWFCTFIQQ